jgi:hypothetical protein
MKPLSPLLILLLSLGMVTGACSGGDNDEPTAATSTVAEESGATATSSSLPATATADLKATIEAAAGGGATATSAPGRPTATPDASVPVVTPTAREDAGTPETDLTPTTVNGASAVSQLEQHLIDALLLPDDIGAGWSDDGTEIQTDKFSEDANTLCGADAFPRRREKLAQVERQLSNDGIEMILLHNVTAFEESVAIEAMDYARDVSGCSEWTEDDTTYTLAPMLNEPHLGDDSFGLRLSFDAGTGEIVEGDWIFVRVGGLIAIVSYFGRQGSDFAPMTSVVEAAGSKLALAAVVAGLVGEDTSDGADGALTATFDALLLTAADLPGDWSEVDRGIPTDDDRYGVCEAPAFPEVLGALTEVQVDFALDADDGPFLWHSLAVMPSGEGDAAMDFIRQNGSCSGWTEDSLRFQVTEIDAPTLGNESFAVIVSTQRADEGPVQVEFLFTRVGDVISVILVAARGELDPVTAEESQSIAVEKLEDALVR